VTRRFVILATIIVGLGALLWGCNDMKSVGYRLSLEVETPSGLRTGSSVVRADVQTSSPWYGQAGPAYQTRGEAVFVDLGDGKHVVALLTGGPRGEFADWHRYMPWAPFQAANPALGAQRRSFEYVAELRGSAEIPRGPVPLTFSFRLDVMPTLVTFTDLADPASARVVPPTAEGFAAAFGPGFAFKRATVEIVPGGVWPFSLIPLGWPQWLFGAPVTRGIEARLPWYGRVTFDQMRNPDGSTLSLEQRQYWATILGSFVRKQ
jgi:hypothetical protein